MYNYVISLYSHFEVNVGTLCADIVSRRKLPFSLEGFSGSLADRLRRFFLAFGLPKMEESEVGLIKELSRVRNAIVHAGGMVGKKETKLRNILKQAKHIRIEDEQIQVDYQYCQDMRDRLLALFRKLFERLEYRTNYTISKVEKGDSEPQEA